MDIDQLEKAIRCDALMQEITWGVFTRSGLPSPPLLPGAYILNSTDEPGEHWLLLYVDDDGAVEMYDSLGRSEETYGLHLKSKTLPSAVQKPNTNTCGLYVLYFLYWRSRHIPMDVIFDSLKQNSENIVQQHYASLCQPNIS